MQTLYDKNKNATSKRNVPQFLFLMKLTTMSDKTDSHKIITLQKSKHGKGNHVTLGYFGWMIQGVEIFYVVDLTYSTHTNL